MRKFVAILAIASIAGCGGGGGASAVPNAPTHTASIATKSIRIVVPGSSKTGSIASQYVSRNTQGVGVSFGASPFTFPANTAPTATFDVSGASPLCTVTNATTGARTCTLTVAAQVGSDDFQVTAWDTVPSPTTGFTSDKALSTVTVLSQAIAPGTNTPLSLTLNGIVNSINTTVSPSSLPAMATGGAPVSATVSVNALDAYGNVIMGSGNWIDASGNALTVTVTPTSAPNGGPMLTTPSTPTGVTAVAPTFAVSYPGGSTWGATFMPAVTGGTIAGSVTGATLNVTPAVTLFTAGIAASASPWRITSASDGNLYFTESGINQIARISQNGTIAEISDTNGGVAMQPSGITQASDGNIWWVMVNAGSAAQIQYVPTSSFGSTSIVTVHSLNPYGGQQDLVDGGDGYVYITEPGAADIYSVQLIPFGLTNTFSGSGVNTPVGIVKGSDGNLWFADSTAGAIRYLLMPGHTFSASFAETGFPQYVTLGSDGNMWFTASTGNYVASVTPTGVTSSLYATPLSLGAVNGITSGSDGALWFAGRGPSAPGNGGIGRVSTAGVVTTYFTGFGATDDPFGMTNDANGYIWFTEPSANKIGRLIY